MRYTEFLTEDELFEINMSPSNLQKLTKEIPGALVGLEFEMIVPDAYTGDDDQESENDYDYDERARSFSNIEDFWMGGDGNNSRRDVRAMVEALREGYFEWASEQRYEQWENDGYDFFRDYVEGDFDDSEAHDEAKEEIAEANPEMDQDSQEFIDLVAERVEEKKEAWIQSEWDEQGNLWDSARDSWEDSADWPDEDDYLELQGYNYQSNLESFAADHDVYWPHTTYGSSREENIDQIANEFGEAVGRDVKWGSYHSVGRSSQQEGGFYIIETDSSLNPNDSDDEAGLEFVSPPLPLADMMEEIKKVAAWAAERGCYTGKSNKTGLHMNVSVPDYSLENLDYVKLVLLLGDNHILKEFDRVGYSYAESSFDLLTKSLARQPQKAEEAMKKMKQHFDLAASKAIHSGTTNKYVSVNTKENRVEFRSPGGDYLSMFASNPMKLLAPMMRFVVALDAAVDPEKYKDEYQKKLYKFLSKAVDKKSKDVLSLFTDYAAGKGMPTTALKALLQQRNQERELKRPGEGVKVGGRRSNPDGNWVLFRQHSTGDYVKPYDVEVLYRFNAAGSSDADVVRDQYVQEHNPSFQVQVASDPDKKNGQPGDYKAKQATGTKSNWGVYQKSGNIPMRYNGEYIRFDDVTEAEATEKLKTMLRGAGVGIDDYELRKVSKYELYRVANGQTVEYDGKPIVFYASTPEEAEDTKLPRIVHDFGLGQPNAFSARSVLTPPAHTTTTSDTSGRQAYNIRDITSNTIVRAFMANNRQEAIQKFHDFRASQGGDNLGHYRLEAADENGESTADQSAVAADGSQQATAINGVPMWAIYRISDGEVVHRFADHTSSHSRTALTWLRDNGYTENPSLNFRVRAMSVNEINQPVAGSTQDIQQQRAQGGFTGAWKIVDDSTGQELHRFSGVGNVQADANRVAAQWLQQHGPEGSNMTEISVLPIMGDQ